MRWQGGRRSRNVEDRRGSGGRRNLFRGGIGSLVVILIALYLGVDPTPLLQGLQQASPPPSQPSSEDLRNDPLADMVYVVLGDTEDVWNSIFAEQGAKYREPTLVLFRGSTESRCGLGKAAMGPFYCPADEKAYIDLSFYETMRTRFNAPGDFAQAYVIAHEVGHHVQNIVGTSGEVHAMKQRVSKAEANALSVRLELQADCYAGVWGNRAHKARNLLEEGDVEEALVAAAAIGDDTLQRQSTGTIVPESFTHGTAAQRQRWFNIGLQSGDVDKCNTFAASRL